MFKRLLLIFLLALLTACAPRSQGVYQYAVFDDFAAGQYAGTIPLSALKTHGDFGLGTFHGLDGEMIVLDGVIYRADASCSLSRPGPATLSPFAELVFFKPEASCPVSESGDLAALAKWLDAKLPPGPSGRRGSRPPSSTSKSAASPDSPRPTPLWRRPLHPSTSGS